MCAHLNVKISNVINIYIPCVGDLIAMHTNTGAIAFGKIKSPEDVKEVKNDIDTLFCWSKQWPLESLVAIISK